MEDPYIMRLWMSMGMSLIQAYQTQPRANSIQQVPSSFEAL